MRKKGKGQLLILVLGVMGIGMITIGPLLAYVDLSLRLSTQSNLRNSAYYAAEAGIQMFIGDLYQANTDISKTYTGIMNDYNFSTTATNGSGTPGQPAASSIYVDPGITMYMRPMVAKGCNCNEACTDTALRCYPFVAGKGKTVKINWAGYTSVTSTTSREPYDKISTTTERLYTTISLVLASNGSLVAYKTPTPEETYASDEARIVANTLVVPGSDISGGKYIVRFKNLATRGASPPYADSYATSQFFMTDADAEWYTFNGSITGPNCSHFFDTAAGGGGWPAGNVTIMAINEDNGDRPRGGAGWGSDPDVNTFSFFCDYVSLSVTSNVSGNITTNTYTYTNVTPAGTGYNRSYRGITTVGSGGDLGRPSFNTAPMYHSPAIYGGDYYPWTNNDTYANYVTQRMFASGGITELDDGNYSKISAPDGNRMLATYNPRPYNNSCMWYVFNVPEGRSGPSRNQVTRIDVHWEGYQTKAPASHTWWEGNEDNRDNDALYLLLWNYQNTANTSDDRYHILSRKQVDAGNTWVKIEQGGYADYLITSTSSRDGKNAVTINCYIRQTPGPSAWWEEQSLEILSWNVHIW